MFTLVTDHSKYIRVRRGADQGAVEKELKSPVDDVFAGEILLRAEGMEIYVAKPHDSYASVARKFGLTEEEPGLFILRADCMCRAPKRAQAYNILKAQKRRLKCHFFPIFSRTNARVQ